MDSSFSTSLEDEATLKNTAVPTRVSSDVENARKTMGKPSENHKMKVYSWKK